MELPKKLLESLEGVEGFDKETFEKVHASGEQVTSLRVNPVKQSEIKNQKSKMPWAHYGYYLDQRPSFTFDPLFHAGTYYVQEASSMFLEQALKQCVDLSLPLRVLDLCASPGGKSTHIQSLISKESLLVSNDVIRSRANVLKENIIKWGCENVVVTNNDPKDFSKQEDYFDVIVVDAPCSGSGLFRRDEAAMDEWSENNVALCSQRQQRILADVWPALKKDGVLIYSTCSYSKEEDEEIMDWISDQLPTTNVQLALNTNWNITTTVSPTENYGYRFWPNKIKGEGFFLACFKKNDGESETDLRYRRKPESATKKELEMIEKWVQLEGKEFIKYENTVYAWPAHLIKDFSILLEQLRVIYSGVLCGELMRDKLVPDHALAMSTIFSSAIHKTELSLEQAIKFLQRKNLQIETKTTGWQLFTFQQHPLGWANVLPNRINNYYPKEMRILKDN